MVWFSTLVNVDSKPRFQLSLMAMSFARPALTAIVPGRLQSPDAGIGNPSRVERSVGKRVEVEVIARRAVDGNRIANPVRPNNRPVSGRVRIGLVSGYAAGRGEVRPCFQQRDRVDIPTAEDAAHDRRRVQPLSSFAEWQCRLRRSTQHLRAVYLPESGSPRAFWDVDLGAARPGRSALVRWGSGRSSGEVLSQQEIGVFIGAALPQTLRIAKVHFHIGGAL